MEILVIFIGKVLTEIQTLSEDVHTFVWHIQFVFLCLTTKHSWPVLESILTEHSIPIHNSQTGRVTDFLSRYQNKFSKKKILDR